MPVLTKLESRGVDVLAWTDFVDELASSQARNVASMKCVPSPVVLCPDTHGGYGAPVGCVLPTRGAVIPSAVGVDLGCGMIAVETNLTSADLPDDLGDLHDKLVATIPAGKGKFHDSHAVDPTHFPGTHNLTADQFDTAWSQMGTLGGGNHFVEVSLDERDRVWVVLHSGSRGIGNKLANIHIDKAKGLMKKWFIELDDPDLAYLVEGTPEFDHYIRDMLWSQDYALANRETMMDSAIRSLVEVVGRGDIEEWRVQTHHNYTEKEHHGKLGNLWITRKGAIRARVGDFGVIPGSMGASTYIVEGLGNPASYCSASHGAGRTMSRAQARREIDLQVFKDSMDGKSWDESMAADLLDEAPGAYKEIGQVMANQADLVRPVRVLHQILNMKGVK